MRKGETGDSCEECGIDLNGKSVYRVDTLPENGGYPIPEQDLCKNCTKDRDKEFKDYFKKKGD